MTVSEIKIGGFGGQGVILTGLIIGRAAAIYDNKYSTMTQAFGPEARGSSCSSQVIVSDQRILYPYVSRPQILVVMSQDAYNKFLPELAPGGMLLVEEELVKVANPPKGIKIYGIPATRLAEELGRKMVLNIVMVGFFTSTTRLINADAVRKAVTDSVPRGTEKLNLSAFDKGYDWGAKLVGKA